VRISDYVIYNDRQLIVMCKPAGMPTQEDKTGDPSLHRITQAYCKHDVHVVHRLDRPCSGIVVFAKTPSGADHLTRQFKNRTVGKYYWAVVSKGIEPPDGELRHHLEKDSRGKMHVTEEEGESSEAVLKYRKVQEIDNYALLSIDLTSGRMHQIRVQLSATGYPIKGDVKYGFRRGNPGRYIHLHAYLMELEHPTKGQRMQFTCLPAAEAVWDAFDLANEKPE
jgi:23S rRNA pseudouridine1911/1915/1917 synthase